MIKDQREEGRPSCEDERFTSTLRRENSTAWTRATTHRFVRELHAGTVPDAVMAAYLVQDVRFVDDLLALVGAAMSTPDCPAAARRRLARFAGEVVAGTEHGYFERALAHLQHHAETASPLANEDRPGPRDRVVADWAATTGFKALMREARDYRSYAAALSVLVVAEWLYLEWAADRRGNEQLPRSWVHAEWITLHDNDDFAQFVAFLRSELDRVGPGPEEGICRELFARAVRLENDFFDATADARQESR